MGDATAKGKKGFDPSKVIVSKTQLPSHKSRREADTAPERREMPASEANSLSNANVNEVRALGEQIGRQVIREASSQSPESANRKEPEDTAASSSKTAWSITKDVVRCILGIWGWLVAIFCIAQLFRRLIA